MALHTKRPPIQSELPLLRSAKLFAEVPEDDFFLLLVPKHRLGVSVQLFNKIFPLSPVDLQNLINLIN